MIKPHEAAPYRFYWARPRFKTAMVTICYVTGVGGKKFFVCPSHDKSYTPDDIAEVIAEVPAHPPTEDDR